MAEPTTDTSVDAEQRFDSLHNPTFHGLLIAEFLAAFNDQCIHAAAMFFAIRTDALSESSAIALMPLLFYAPWAIFAPLSGYLADKISKRYSLIFWKVAEVGITGFALLGFWLGVAYPHEWYGRVGPFIVMSCVFLMGTHSAFYVPNKYGVLPEIFSVRALSKANGLIESTTFLAIILGTTAGGVLSKWYRGEEYWIGIFLVLLALLGTLTSLLIRRMKPADPTRPFPGWAPWRLFGPLFKNLRVLLSYRLSTVAVLGLSFFTFMVAYMRATMYMYGESRNPPWSEEEVSLIVAVVSLGVGIGSPLAGFISGGKVELGLVPIGALGMIFSLILASLAIFNVQFMVYSLIAIGLFASFYLVPLYSLLQYSAPRGSKGSSVATNNFIATTGAILASVVFLGLVTITHATGAMPKLETQDIATGTLEELEKKAHLVEKLVLFTDTGEFKTLRAKLEHADEDEDELLPGLSIGSGKMDSIIKLARDVEIGEEVTVSTYKVQTQKGEVNYFLIREKGTPAPVVYNNETLPRFLFAAAAILLLCTLLVLWKCLPDLIFRSFIWLHYLGKPFVRVEGYDNLPRDPAILVTDCLGFEDSLAVVQGVVRPVRFLVTEKTGTPQRGLLRLLARWAGMRFCTSNSSAAEIERVAAAGDRALRNSFQVAVNFRSAPETADALLRHLEQSPASVVPIACRRDAKGRTVLIIGQSLSAQTAPERVRAAVAELAGEPLSR